MSDAEKKKGGEKPDKKPDDDFRIRDFPDLRRLRKSYLCKDGKPVGVDSGDTPLPDEQEEDFGLQRSTTEEALEFLRESLCEDDKEDPLREFLDDE